MFCDKIICNKYNDSLLKAEKPSFCMEIGLSFFIERYIFILIGWKYIIIVFYTF